MGIEKYIGTEGDVRILCEKNTINKRQLPALNFFPKLKVQNIITILLIFTLFFIPFQSFPSTSTAEGSRTRPNGRAMAHLMQGTLLTNQRTHPHNGKPSNGLTEVLTDAAIQCRDAANQRRDASPATTSTATTEEVSEEQGWQMFYNKVFSCIGALKGLSVCVNDSH